ncbi:hypothetical protein ACNI3K_06635 [Demequina sp. SO4-13]|uniref:hypothetical protein n=1 Tax=Demequina sp. SO4-13 TaxID=3401027 RepID=UPI003AF817B1
MTDESRPLSRRERRAQEARAAARPADDTDALGDAPISESIPTHSPEGRPLTRRERRRLERSRQPLETWTAEEEMIATGQIPAMTPERIAEQERLAREKAEQAQRDGQSAPEDSQAFQEAEEPPPVAAPPVEDAGADEREAGPVEDAQTDEPPEAAAPAATDAAQPLVFEPEPEPVQEPESAPEPEAEASFAFDPETQAEFEPETEPAPDERAAPEPDEDAPQPIVPQRTSLIPSPPDEPSAPEGEHADDAAAAGHAPADDESQVGQATDEEEPEDAPVEPPEAVWGMPAGMSPEMYEALFPPGSLQRRLMEQQATDQAAESAQEPAEEDPAAEIRRLTEQAVAGLDAASSRRTIEATDVNDPAAEAAAKAVLPNAWGPAASPVESPDAAADTATEWPVQADPSPASAPSWPSAPAAASAPQPAPSYPSAPSSDSAPSSQSAPGSWEQAEDDRPSDGTGRAAQEDRHERPDDETPVSIDEAPFDAILGHHPGTAALDEASTASAEMHRPAFHTVARPAHSVEAPATVPGGPAGVPDASAQLAPHYAAFDVPQWSTTTPEQAESPWAAHPLMRVDRPAPELPEVESAKDIPRPDLSSVRRPAFTPQTDGFPSIEPVPTGQIQVPQRERPDLDAEGGPRHFKWAHLAVFGAVAFLLGVVVWNLTLRP